MNIGNDWDGRKSIIGEMEEKRRRRNGRE